MSSESCARFRESFIDIDTESCRLSYEQVLHLNGCDRCSEYLRTLMAACSAVDTLPDIEPPDGMVGRLNSALSQLDIRLQAVPPSHDRSALEERRPGARVDRRSTFSLPLFRTLPASALKQGKRLLNSSSPLIMSVLLLVGYDLMNRERYSRDHDRHLYEKLNLEINRQEGEHQELRQKSGQIFETFVDKFEALAREVDALAGALKQSQEVNPPPLPKELEGPDTLEAFGLEESEAGPPPTTELGLSDFLQGAEGPAHRPSNDVAPKAKPKLWRYREQREQTEERRGPAQGLILPEAAQQDAEPQPSASPSPSPTAEDDQLSETAPLTPDDVTEPDEQSLGIEDEVPTPDRQDAGAVGYFESLTKLQSISFQPADGMWDSGYTPAVLLDRERERLEPTLARHVLRSGPLALHRLAAPSPVGLDTPGGATLDLGLRQSLDSVDGPARLLVAVELSTAAANATQRPALSFIVAIDLSGPSSAAANRSLWQLAQLLRTGLHTSDQMTLLVGSCDRSEPSVYEPGQVTYGLLTHLAAQAETCSRLSMSPSVLFSYAIERALEARVVRTASGIARNDSPVRNHVALLLTNLERLDPAEQVQLSGTLLNALNKQIPFAVAVSGFRPGVTVLEEALSSHEKLLVPLGDRESAEVATEQVLRIGSDIVAQAIELRIALAPGVQLVDIAGSRRLSQSEAEQLVGIQQEISRKLRRTAGIKEQLPEHERAITILIPQLQASDAHALILDLMVPGPGAVLKVRARYKDMLGIRNTECSSALQLAPGAQSSSSQREELLRSVIKLRLAHHLHRAASSLELNDENNALLHLDKAAAIVQAAAASSLVFSDAAGNRWAERLLDEYRAEMRHLFLGPKIPQSYLVDSLRLSARTLSQWSAV